MKASEERNMKKNISIINNNGFSLLEITIVLIIISILLSAVIPVLSRSYLEKAANKTALDMLAIEEASRAYYTANNYWPANVAALQTSGYLPSGWNATNPFVNYEPDLVDFTYHTLISPNLSLLTVYTNVPVDAQPIIQNLLPTPSVDPLGKGHNVYSSISVPGGSPAPPVFVVTGTIGNGGTIPLPAGYKDSQCQWFVSPYNALIYDSSGKGGCESLESVSAYLTGANGRTAVATTTGDCRGSWTFTLNYIGICTKS
jgi:prepilin-type N-terminal cleavage/methylation domain-containing protein